LPEGSLCSPLDAQEHLALHEEVGRFEQDMVTEPAKQAGLSLSATADAQPGRVLLRRLEEEPPRSRFAGITPQHKRPLRFDKDDRQRRSFGMQPYVIPDLDMLELRQDTVGVLKMTADKIFQPGVAVEAAFIPADLNQPGPDGG